MEASPMDVSIQAATGFDDCIRKCTACGIGASNGIDPDAVTYIHREPLNNIPEQIRDGAAGALEQALNVQNRLSKRRRFGFSTSEDALTWVVFAHLLRSGNLAPVFARLGISADPPGALEPALLLWGSPMDGNVRAADIRGRLAKLCRSVNEDVQSFSEPDVLVDLGPAGLVLVEVKYLSGNDGKPSDYAGWKRYLPTPQAFVTESEVRATGHYELARYWWLLTVLAQGRPATLINLGPARLFRGLEGQRLDRFASTLVTGSSRRFVKLTWSDFLHAVGNVPDWLTEFLQSRRLAE